MKLRNDFNLDLIWIMEYFNLSRDTAEFKTTVKYIKSMPVPPIFLPQKINGINF